MQKKFLIATGFSLGLAMFIAPTIAQNQIKRPVAIEKELLGIRILQSYRDVLARHGAPNRIFKAIEDVGYVQAQNRVTGELTGGIIGVESSGSNAGGGGAALGGGASGFAGGGAPGLAGGGVGPSSGGALAGGGGGGRGPSSGGRGPSSGGGFSAPGSAGGGGSRRGADDNGDFGGPAGGGAIGGGGGNSSGAANFEEGGGFTWVYLNRVRETAYQFDFNKDGRVIRIIQRGKTFGLRNRRGIGLGDPVDKVYRTYGYTDRVREESNMFSLIYNDTYHTHFLALKGTVVGMAVFLKEDQYMRLGGSNTAAGGGATGFGGPGFGGAPSAAGGFGSGGPSSSGGLSGGGGGGKLGGGGIPRLSGAGGGAGK